MRTSACILVLCTIFEVHAVPRVTTQYGVVVGTTMKAIPTGRQISAFRGIPYAKPPVANLRFKAPEDIEPWSEELNATEDASPCIQKDFLMESPQVLGQEDCLYLNVYTPSLNGSSKLLPVMVYIHGGGFFTGSSISSTLGPEYLLAKDVVLVTFNYRLGPMGFLSTNSKHVPGNAGLKDQVAALRWVRSNVASFGGDPDLVTIFGQSAGGVSVHYHMLSNMSAGLFHRAIAQSGVALCVWANTRRELAPQIAAAQAMFVNCTLESTEKMTECLRNVDAKKLVDSTSLFQTWGSDPLSVYSPVVEPPPSGDEDDTEPRFITENPFVLLRQGHVASVPFALGVVPGEGTIHANAILNKPKLVEDFNARQTELGPFILGLSLSVDTMDQQRDVWSSIARFYLTNTTVSPESDVSKFVHMYGDRMFLHGVYHAAELHRYLTTSPVYLYKFAYRGEFSYEPIHSHLGPARYHGPGHCDELVYLFRSVAVFRNLRAVGDYRDSVVRNLMVRLWTNFAKHGNFSDDLNDLTKPPLPRWLPLSRCKPLKYANIATYLTTGRADFYQERLAFWESLPMRENQLAEVATLRSSDQC